MNELSKTVVRYSPGTTSYRIRVAISLTGLKLFDFSKKSGIPKQTLWIWESGNINLSKKGAIRLSEALSRFNIECSPIWLLTGHGEPPKIKETPQNILQDSCELKVNEISIVKETEYFRSLSPNHVIVGVRDNSMVPFYSNGDYVGGIKIPFPDLKKAYNENCIVTLKDGKTLVRRFVKRNENDKHTLYALNVQAAYKDLVLTNIELESIAVIVWHRRCLFI
jgi:transcriptional regulator with XRE-family HTH domain